LNFYWCSSNRDGTPYCKIEFLDANDKPILTSTVRLGLENDCRGDVGFTVFGVISIAVDREAARVDMTIKF